MSLGVLQSVGQIRMSVGVGLACLPQLSCMSCVAVNRTECQWVLG